MPSPRRHFITGVELVAALALMRTTVKWIVGSEAFHIPASQAVCIAKASTYEGKYHKGRVYFIREVVTRSVPVFVEEYRRDRAILCWDKSVDARTTALWDRILGNPKAKAAYSNVVPSGTAAAASL
jgi:hypothetical protein